MTHSLIQQVIPDVLLERIEASLLEVGKLVSGESFGDIDAMWHTLAQEDRRACGLIYNAAKRLPEVHALVPILDQVIRSRWAWCKPALIDINFRIDAPNEDQYLFSWHQDYWFSICSPKALVTWMPLRDLDEVIGGVEVLSVESPRILSVERGESESYSDSLVLAEPLPEGERRTPMVRRGDILSFTFDELHRSLPNRSGDRCRWSIQLRWADLGDPEFLREDFKPGVVHPNFSTYWERVRNG